MSESFASLQEHYSPVWRPRGWWSTPGTWREVSQVLGVYTIWVPWITNSNPIQKPDCLLFLGTTYKRDDIARELSIWKYDVILRSDSQVYGHIQIEKVGEKKYIKSVTLIRWENGIQGMADFLSRATEKEFWITYDCKNYQKLSMPLPVEIIINRSGRLSIGPLLKPVWTRDIF